MPNSSSVFKAAHPATVKDSQSGNTSNPSSGKKKLKREYPPAHKPEELVPTFIPDGGLPDMTCGQRAKRKPKNLAADLI